jgi:hypothetical protein
MILLGGALLAVCMLIAVLCTITRDRPFYVERDVGYYRGPGDHVNQDIDSVYWQGGMIYISLVNPEWHASGPKALASFHADHPPQPRWFFGRTRPRWDLVQRPRSIWNWLGFYYYKVDVPFAVLVEHHRFAAFSPWILVPPLLAFSVLALRKHWWLYRKQSRENLCPHCGYDIRATPDRCPECGHEIARLKEINPPSHLPTPASCPDET